MIAFLFSCGVRRAALLATVVTALVAPQAQAAANVPTPFVAQMAPIDSTQNVAVRQKMEATWDNSKYQLQTLDSISSPQGWGMEYQTRNGWLAAPPLDLSSITGLRASGTVISDGLSGGDAMVGRQIVRGQNAIVVAAVPGTFAIPTNGDGWDVFFDSKMTKVFNVYHHSSPAKVDCHERSNGTQCAGWPQGGMWVAGGSTSNRATGVALDDGRVLIPGGNDRYGGFSCVMANGGSCGSSFYVLTDAGGYAQDSVVGAFMVNKKIYTMNFINGRLLCFDPKSSGPCVGENNQTRGDGSDAANVWYLAQILADQSRIYGISTLGQATKVFCYDAVRARVCKGWEIAKNARIQNFNFFMPLSKGGNTFDSICAAQMYGGTTCFAADGTEVQPSVALVTAVGQVSGTYAANYGNATIDKGRTYFTAPFGGTEVFCFDAVADAICWRGAGMNLKTPNTYSVRIDPSIPGCIWTNSDNFGIHTWNVSGNLPTENCAGIAPSISFSADASAIRLACPQHDPISTWQRYQLVGANGATTAELSVYDSAGVPIPGWQKVVAKGGGFGQALSNGTASWDLSALTVAKTGLYPRFDVSLPSAGVGAVITASLSAIARPPEMCWSALPVSASDGGLPNNSNRARPGNLIDVSSNFPKVVGALPPAAPGNPASEVIFAVKPSLQAVKRLTFRQIR